MYKMRISISPRPPRVQVLVVVVVVVVVVVRQHMHIRHLQVLQEEITCLLSHLHCRPTSNKSLSCHL